MDIPEYLVDAILVGVSGFLGWVSSTKFGQRSKSLISSITKAAADGKITKEEAEEIIEKLKALVK